MRPRLCNCCSALLLPRPLTVRGCIIHTLGITALLSCIGAWWTRRRRQSPLLLAHLSRHDKLVPATILLEPVARVSLAPPRGQNCRVFPSTSVRIFLGQRGLGRCVGLMWGVSLSRRRRNPFARVQLARRRSLWLRTGFLWAPSCLVLLGFSASSSASSSASRLPPQPLGFLLGVFLLALASVS